eukprot:scaffold182_cov71-Phaeocystis_antarctica.AAC.1
MCEPRFAKPPPVGKVRLHAPEPSPAFRGSVNGASKYAEVSLPRSDATVWGSTSAPLVANTAPCTAQLCLSSEVPEP